MSIALPTHIDKPTFLAWVQGREERYELVRGRVVPAPRATRRRALIVTNLVVALHAKLDPQKWIVLPQFGLETGSETVRCADIVVDRSGGTGGDCMATAPVLISEVLSPITAEIDPGDKVGEYLQLSSLLAYLVFAQDGPKAYVWMR